NIELEFNSAYQIIEIDASTQLPNSVIPQSILDYVSEHYPDNYITDWELENNHQQIELDNGLELEFGLDGVFIRIDSDGDDDDTDEVVLTDAEIPAEIKTYVSTYFPSNTIVKAVKETDDSVITYDIDLSGDIDLEFNSSFQIIGIDADTQLPDAVVPQAILTYVSRNYPNNFIISWELEAGFQYVELNNDIELKFDLNGVFISTDGGDDDPDEVVLTDAEIPAEIKTYVSTYFPSNTIVKAVKETDDNVITYDIDLSGDIDLEFNSSFQIIGIDADTQLPDAVVPQAILTYVSQNYPNNFIISWELEAGFQYVELNNDIELKFDLNGVFISVDND
ncbi:MAG: PepSY-like domain-containing protein, partial [Bacteroidales bacterium]|nr:PepSY-like domain-containing protein [Bacteroidales bacterium]